MEGCELVGARGHPGHPPWGWAGAASRWKQVHVGWAGGCGDALSVLDCLALGHGYDTGVTGHRPIQIYKSSDIATHSAMVGDGWGWCAIEWRAEQRNEHFKSTIPTFCLETN